MNDRVASLLASVLGQARQGPLLLLLDGRPDATILVPDAGEGRGERLVALFDGLEVAFQAHLLAREPWPLERLDILAVTGNSEAEADAEAVVRSAVNRFWGWDAGARWDRPRRHDRLPTVWTCRLVSECPVASAPGFDVTLDESADGGLPAGIVPVAIPDPDREAARHFLRRFTGQPAFAPGQWEAVREILRGKSALLASGPEGAEPMVSLLAGLLPGIVLRVKPTLSGAGCPASDPLDVPADVSADVQADDQAAAPADREFDVAARRLQDQRYLQRLRQRLRAVPGGLALVVVDAAERASAWCGEFEPAYTRVLGAVQEIATRPGIPLLAVVGDPDERVLGDVAEGLRVQDLTGDGGAAAGSDIDSPAPLHVELVASEPDYEALKPIFTRFPGWRLEADLARRELAPLAQAIASGGFATVPVSREVSPDGDSGRADRFRGLLSRLHALGFIGSFGENASAFQVKHPVVLGWSAGAYLAPLAERAAGRVPGLDPGELAGLGPVDLCERLVEAVLGRDAREARRTAVFFERFICPGLHREGPIAVPKRPQQGEAIDFEPELLLWRLAQLDVVREYFLNAEDRTWSVAFRKPDRAVIARVLGDRRSVLLRGAGGDARGTGAIASGTEAPEMVVQAVEAWIQLDYEILLPARVVATRDMAGTAPAAPGPGSSRTSRPRTGRPEPGEDIAGADGPGEAVHPERDADLPGSAADVDAALPDVDADHPDVDAAFSRPLATLDPAPIVAGHAARRGLGDLRARAAEHARSNPDDLSAHAILCLAAWELGDAREASLALSRGLDAALGRPDPAPAEIEALLDLAPPELAAIELGLRREPLAPLLGGRRFRHLLHDAYAAADRGHDADAELLLELRPLAAGWQSAADELAALDPVLSKLESGYERFDA